MPSKNVPMVEAPDADAVSASPDLSTVGTSVAEGSRCSTQQGVNAKVQKPNRRWALAKHVVMSVSLSATIGSLVWCTIASVAALPYAAAAATLVLCLGYLCARSQWHEAMQAARDITSHLEVLDARITATKRDAEVARVFSRIIAETIIVLGADSPPIPSARKPVQTWLRSQYGDELVVWHLLSRKTAGYYVEAGAYDGVTYSNTYFLEQIGWTGLLVEPATSAFEKCRAARPRSKVVQAVLGSQGVTGTTSFCAVNGPGDVGAYSFGPCSRPAADVTRRGGSVTIERVPTCSLDDLLSAERPERIDFLSLDVEGAELDVLKGANLQRWRPTIIGIEGDRIDVRKYLTRLGYERVLRLDGNTYYRLRSVPDSMLDDASRGGSLRASFLEEDCSQDILERTA